MSPTRKPTPTVVVLTEEALIGFMAEVQKGFVDLNKRLDALEETITKPGLATAKLRREIADAALKAAVSRPPVRRTPRS